MNCDNLTVAYGESLRLTTTINSDLAGLVSLTFYVGLGGNELPILTSEATVTATEAIVYEQSINIDPGVYKYQYKAIFDDGSIEKYPELTTFDNTLPSFIVTDSIDEAEVS
jgi:hypothetical protein